LQEHLASDQFAIPVIFVTAFGDIPMTVRAMKAGAIEFLIKPLDDRTLVETVRQAIRRSDLALDREERLRTLRARHDSLSRREREVMALVVTGLLNKQVGGELGISEITVKAHRGNMMRKMGASSLVHLVAMAGMLHDSPVLGNQQSMDDRVMARSFGSQ
jgi:FixJ family two-component response regulator